MSFQRFGGGATTRIAVPPGTSGSSSQRSQRRPRSVVRQRTGLMLAGCLEGPTVATKAVQSSRAYSGERASATISACSTPR